MSNVYLTLVSDVTSYYSGNMANKFKVKPGLRLPTGEGWKVSIATAILPKMALFKDLQKETINMLEMWYNVDGVGGSDGRKNSDVAANDLKVWEKEHMCRTGVEFMNAIKSTLDERRHNLIPAGKKILTSQWVKLEWTREQGEPELVVHHSDASTDNRVHKKLAERMLWSDPQNTSNNEGGSNLVITYPRHIRPTSSDLGDNKAVKMQGSWLLLSSNADLRFINLNAAFEHAINLHARPLIVTAKVTAGSNTVTQPLGQVYYAPQGRDRYLFTPPVEELYHVHTNEWDEVEVTVKELDGNLVTFQSDSQCLIRLHFKKD